MKTKNKIKRRKEKIKTIELDPFAHPLISGTFAGLGAMAYNHKDFLDEFFQTPSINSNTFNHLFYFSVYTFLCHNFFRALNKFEGPNRFKSYLKLLRTSKEYRKKSEDEINFDEFEKDIGKCFPKESSYKYLIYSQFLFNKNKKLEGIEELLKYSRHFERTPRFAPMNPIIDISAYLIYGLNFLENYFLVNFKKEESHPYRDYKELANSLNFGHSKFLLKHILKKINENEESIEDKILYGSLMDYIVGTKDKNWNPFLKKLSEFQSQYSNLECKSIYGRVTECRNSVFRYSGLYMKKFSSKKSFDTEMNNLKVIFNKLNHVLSHGIGTEANGEYIFIAPQCEETFYDALPNMDLNTKESFILQALQNLADIEVIAEHKGNFSVPDENHYTSRLIDLAGFLELDDEFKEMWHNYISKKLITISHLYYKDSNPRNYIKEDDLLFEIDFEGDLKKPFGLDLVNVLEFSRVGLEDNAFDYVENHIANLKSKKIDLFLSVEDYEICRVQRHMELLGYRHRDYCVNESPEMHQYMHEYSANVLDALIKLSSGANGSEYTKLTRKLSQSLEDIL